MQLKIVPNSDPNADGEWITVELAPGLDPYAFELDGYHVVATRRTPVPDDLQNGGPMHAQFLYTNRGR